MGSFWRSSRVFAQFFFLWCILLPLVSGAKEEIETDTTINNPLNKEKPGPYKVFKTEPSFIPSIINVTHPPQNLSLLAPGYIFIAPHIGSNGFGPQILDHQGELVWYGLPSLVSIPGSHVYGMDLRACDYQGSLGTHLCWSEGRPKDREDQGVKAGGANRVFSNAYEAVTEDFTDMGGMTSPNPHEFNMLPGGDSFLQTVYQPKSMDLTPYGGGKEGWVLDGCFQEIDVRFRKVLFKWCFLDHYEVWETYLYLHIPGNKVNSSSGTSGAGTVNNKWDFMHENSVDKNEEGDYLISGRHMSQILKIAGPDSRSGRQAGETLWRLNGRHSDFSLEDDAVFGRQHHCRFISTGAEETVISMFNNAFDGATNATRDRSSGLILRLNNVTMKATVEHMFEQPEGLLSYAQGSAQLLPNGNYHVGWGSNPQWSEFSPNGTLLYHAKAWAHKTKGPKLTNYRSFKQPWVGKPNTKPKLVAYSQSCRSFVSKRIHLNRLKKLKLSHPTPLVAYVSWNGATEVKNWRFLMSHKDPNGPWRHAGNFGKTGFETRAELYAEGFGGLIPFASWVKVEAQDENGNVLAEQTTRTFVPNDKIKSKCGKWDCSDIFRFDYGHKYNRSATCGAGINWPFVIIVAILVLLAIESWNRMYTGFMHSMVFQSYDNVKFQLVPRGPWDKTSLEKA